jgi:hypothetical protein
MGRRARRHLRSLLSRSPAERRLLARALVVTIGVRLGLWFLPFRVMHRMTTSARRRRDAPASDQAPEAIIRSVQAASRRVPGASCLTQALSAKRLLLDAGHDADLRIGVARMPGGPFQAHAWLERDGRIVLGALDDLTRYVPLPSLQERK